MFGTMTGPLEKTISAKIRQVFGQQTSLSALTPLAGDASNRRYYRAFLESPSIPRSVVVMELTGSSLPLSSEELSVFKEAPKELPFLSVHRFLKELGIRVPDLYGHWVDEGILLLEDLGDCCLWDVVQALPSAEVVSWYKKAIDELLRLQILGSRFPDLSCIAFQQRFDFRLYMWEFEHFIQYGLEKETGQTSEAEKKLLMESFTRISRRLDATPPCLNHRDYHSWNLMVHQGGIVVIDFQDALIAPMQYDLTSLLNDRETDRIIQPDLEGQLVGYYLQRREEMGESAVDRDEFNELYLLSALQRDLKVVGRFYYLEMVKGKPGYKKYIPGTLRRVKRNLLRLPGMESTLAILAAHFEDLR
ncbi:MAG: phosphotransferase [Deltaproteobacteria bacterium]|nr:phosphotransferase [Deltaproteobacteria bacterium]